MRIHNNGKANNLIMPHICYHSQADYENSQNNGRTNILIILGAVHRFPGICLIAEENTRKPQLGDRLMKGLSDQSSPQMGSFSSKWDR